MPFAVKSSLDVAFWFMDRALNDREYLQPQKLHKLMFLSQAYYPAAYPGRTLMPAHFVTDMFGPIEPTVFHVLSNGRPNMIDTNPVAEAVRGFLDGIWRRFGQYSAEQLFRKLSDHDPVAVAMEKGEGTEIPLTEMVNFYATTTSKRKADVPAPSEVIKPRMLRSQSGKAVTVSTWSPKTLGGK